MRHVKLIESANILYGYPFDSSLFSEDDSYIPLIRIRDVVPGIASTYYAGNIIKDYVIKEGDILVGMDGNFNLGKWKDKEGLLNQRTLKISAKTEMCIDGYLFHLLGPIFKKIESNTAGGSVKHLSAKTINSIEIPLPPLPIQQEIVRILDSFTSMITNLETELASRQKQYEYYRNKLLTFDENDESVEWKTLGDVCNVITGGEPPKNSIKGNEPTDTMIYPIWANGREVYGYADTYTVEKDSVCISSIGANTGAVFFHKGKFTPIIRLKVLIPLNDKTDVRYLYYAVSRISFKTKKGSVPNMNSSEVKGKHIPIPTLQRQREIVSTLDTFESLITNIKQELEARKKQYEYYREQLLTFEK